MVRRGMEMTGALLSGATLLLMPKCPVCVAAYLALITGLGVSVTTAAHLRQAGLILSGAVLVFLGFKTLARLVRRS